MFLHTTHLLQLSDVYVFQTFKYWHSEAENKAIQNGDKTFFKVKLLNTFNSICQQAFKESIICFA